MSDEEYLEDVDWDEDLDESTEEYIQETKEDKPKRKYEFVDIRKDFPEYPAIGPLVQENIELRVRLSEKEELTDVSYAGENKCPICNRVCPNLDDLKQHLQETHNMSIDGPYFAFLMGTLEKLSKTKAWNKLSITARENWGRWETLQNAIKISHKEALSEIQKGQSTIRGDSQALDEYRGRFEELDSRIKELKCPSCNREEFESEIAVLEHLSECNRNMYEEWQNLKLIPQGYQRCQICRAMILEKELPQHYKEKHPKYYYQYQYPGYYEKMSKEDEKDRRKGTDAIIFGSLIKDKDFEES